MNINESLSNIASTSYKDIFNASINSWEDLKAFLIKLFFKDFVHDYVIKNIFPNVVQKIKCYIISFVNRNIFFLKIKAKNENDVIQTKIAKDENEDEKDDACPVETDKTTEVY